MTNIKLVTTTEDPTPACPCATEPCIVTGPNDPCSVNVQLGDPEDVVYVTFSFHGGRTVEVTLDDHRADHIGGLLKKAHTMVEERRGAMAPADAGPEVRVFHRADGWTVSYEPGTQTCTINHVPEDEGRRACAAVAVWKVVEERDFGLTIGFWCDDDMPAEHRHLAPRTDA